MSVNYNQIEVVGHIAPLTGAFSFEGYYKGEFIGRVIGCDDTEEARLYFYDKLSRQTSSTGAGLCY